MERDWTCVDGKREERRNNQHMEYSPTVQTLFFDHSDSRGGDNNVSHCSKFAEM